MITSYKHRLLFGAAFVAGLALTPQMAVAQAAPENPAAPGCVDDNNDGVCDTDIASADGSQNDGEIVVTGSRLRRDQFNTADPIQVITRNETTQAGFTNTTDVLQSTKVTGGTSQINNLYGGFVVDGGPGVNTVSLRGLGTSRTLVLLNGRRVSPAGSRGAVGVADLNVLPNAVLERIEVLNTGASSIYGSDAIAGVINMVTRRDLNGVEFDASVSVPGEGDGISQRVALLGGFNTDRLHVLGSLEYFRRSAIEFGDREWASCPTGLYGTNGADFGAGDYIDPRTGQVKCFPLENGGVTVNTIGTPNLAGGTVVRAPGVPAGYTGVCNRFRPLPGAGGAVPGYECVGGGALSTNIRDTFSPALLKEDLLSPVETFGAFGQIRYDLDILGNAEIYTEFLFNRRKSNQDGQRQFTLDYPLGSPLIPVGLRFPGAVGAATPTTNGAPIGIRVFADYGIYNNRQEVDYTRVNGGIRGDLPYNWRYDLFAGKSWSDAEYTTDLILTDRLAQSFDVVANPDGTFRCRINISGCVAAPVLTPAVVGGQFPAAWFDFVTDPVTGTTKYTESTFAANIDGPLFRLPGGEVQLALGAEYRKARIDDTPGPDSQRNNLYGFTSSTPTRGTDSVWEVFGEIELPLVRESFIHDLTINASGRYTEYDSYGGDWTYKVGALFSPIRAISFRGSYGTSFRAPLLFEQFLGRTSGFLGSTTDPCADLAAVTNPLVRERCLADGLPADFIQRSSVTSIGVGGAEAGLAAETSTALTGGIVLQPSLGRFGLSLSADYFDIKVDNGVARLTAANVLSQCYNNPERTTCRPELISRDANNALTVVSSYVNISDARVRGIDYNARFTAPLGSGQLRLNAAVTQFLERYSRTFPTQDILDVVGLISNPEWTGQFDATFGMEDVSLRYQVEWIGATDSQDYAEPFGYDPNEYLLRTKDYFLHTASVSFDVTEQFGMTVGVRNIFDKKPPRISADYTNLIGNAPLYSGFDVVGRSFFLGLNAGF